MEIRLNWLYKLNSGRRRTALCSAVALIFEPHFKTVLRGLTTYMNFYFESLSTYIKILSPQDLLGRSLESVSDAVLSQQPSPKNFLQKFLLHILTNLDQIHRDLLKNMRKKFAKNSLDLIVVIKQQQKMTLTIMPCYQRPNCGIVVCLEFNINYLQLHSDQAR